MNNYKRIENNPDHELWVKEESLETDDSQSWINKFNENKYNNFEKEYIENYNKILEQNIKLKRLLKSQRIKALEEVEKMIDECSVPLMSDEELEKFFENNNELHFRVLNLEKFKQRLKQLEKKENEIL